MVRVEDVSVEGYCVEGFVRARNVRGDGREEGEAVRVSGAEDDGFDIGFGAVVCEPGGALVREEFGEGRVRAGGG